jgi:hypothetical protein
MIQTTCTAQLIMAIPVIVEDSRRAPAVHRKCSKNAKASSDAKSRGQKFSFGLASISVTILVVLFSSLCLVPSGGPNTTTTTLETTPFQFGRRESNRTRKMPTSRPKGDRRQKKHGGLVEISFTTEDGSCLVAHMPPDKHFLRVESDGPKLSINDLIADGAELPTIMALPKNTQTYPCKAQ